MKKRLTVFALVLTLLMPCVACSGGGDGIDNTKTQLYVGVYDGGLGADSVYAMAKRFEQKYAEHSFEEGKTGVQVKVLMNTYNNGLENTISDMTEEVFIGTSANANYLARKGLLTDISDVYEKPLNYDFVTGETDASESDVKPKDKIRSDLKYYYRDEEGKYYGFPGATTFYGLVYDIDLFEQENLYFAKDGGFVKSASDARSAGPDGKLETEYDNGLPATYEQFFELCDKIVSLGMTPVMWGGTVQEYVSSFLTALAADNDGKEQTELNYNYDGLATTLVSGVSGDNVEIGASEQISARNGYKLYKQEGRYRALKFLERLTSNPSYFNKNDATSNAFGNTDAQDAFLTSKHPEFNRKRTAMLVEGNWWGAEARGTFLELSAEYGDGDSMETRRFGMLPLPKATADKVGERYTFLERCVGDGFVNGNIAEYKKNLAKSFVQFMFTDESCVEYLKINSICMPIEFDIGDEYSSLTPWGKNMYDLKENAVTATMYSRSKIMQNYSTDLWYSPNLWLSKIGGTTYTYPSFAMINNGASAKTYFDGLSAYWTEDTWKSKFTDI